MLEAFYQNPMLYVGLVFALIGTFGALYFGAGFLAGLPHVFTLDSSDDHREHHRFRITWGFSIMLYTFLLWELVRIVASWFGYPPANTHAFGTALSALAIVLLACGIVVLITNIITKKGGGH